MSLLRDGAWFVEPVDYEFGTPTTSGAVRIRGRDWSVFVKVIQAFRHWPMLSRLSEKMQQHVFDSPLWLQRDLLELADRVPDLLSVLNGLPQLMVHGDASPQNLLIPAAAPDTFATGSS